MAVGAPLEWTLTDGPVLTVVEDVDLPTYSSGLLAWRRVGDIILSLLTLLVALPLICAVALLVKLSSPGPVLFTQTRVGRDGEHFTVLKFRTMSNGTEEEVQAERARRTTLRAGDFKLDADDPRITGIGRHLRKLSLDELPQLWNVLRGDMSLVGIRPIEPGEFATRSAIERAVYGHLRPGLTGLWQIEGRSSVTPRERSALDQLYVETWSPWQDLKILIRTPFALLRIHHAQ